MKRLASARWKGDLKTGNGVMSTETKTLNEAPYSFHTRFEEGNGTNPEELLAAAHAGCFSMALSLTLAGEGLTAEEINTTCTVTIERGEGGFEITGSHLVLRAKIPGADKAAFERAAQAAKGGCPVSKLYKTNITLDATLES
ncbi:MAG: OsmC family protein [Bryobacterales bacterium]|nr:OsmC family protein [Bryobacterales bacterium]